MRSRQRIVAAAAAAAEPAAPRARYRSAAAWWWVASVALLHVVRGRIRGDAEQCEQLLEWVLELDGRLGLQYNEI
jgi:hypothetical protein